MKTEWAHKKLIDLADYYNGMAFKPSDWVESGTKIIRIEQLNNPLGNYDYYQGSYPEINAIHNEDLIFSWSATLKVAIWKWGEGVLNQHLFKVVPFENVDKYFLYYLLDYNMPKLGESSHGSTMKHIKRKELETYSVKIPTTLSAQRRIAAILASADKVIAATQKTIAKYKQMKQGMMEELFNEQCTIFAQTERSSQIHLDDAEVQPKITQKRSGCVMNNVQWRKVRLGECLKQKPDYGINAPAVPYDNNLPTYLRITDITEDGYYSKKDIVSVSSQDALKYVMEEGDLVFARTGASTGKTYLYNPKDGMLVFAGFLIRVRTDANVLLPEYLKYQTQTPQYKNWIAANSMRTGQPGINGNEYEEFPISIPYKNDKPDLAEQRRSAAILSDIDAKIAAEEKVLEKYEKVKRGLMEKLLENE